VEQSTDREPISNPPMVAASKPAVTIFHPDGKECSNAAVLQTNQACVKATSKEIDPRYCFFMGFIGLKRLVFFKYSNYCGLFSRKQI
jgi:hypothetical protein